MIKAIIFDFGDVIMAWDHESIFKNHEVDNSLEAGAISKLMDEYMHGGNLGEYDDIFDFHKKTKPSISLTVEKLNEIFQEANSTMHVNSEMIKYIEELKKKYKIAILSNFTAGLEEMLEKVFNVYHLFDVVVSSYNLKISKPNPEIYRHALEKLNVKANEAVFIDDKERNTKAAEAIGIKSIVFQNFNQFKKDLNKILD